MRLPRAQLARTMLPFALSLLVALAIVALTRAPWVFSPALVAEPLPGTAQLPGDDEEQQPETDRAPRHDVGSTRRAEGAGWRPWLGWTVASVAAVRLVVLVALGA